MDSNNRKEQWMKLPVSAVEKLMNDPNAMQVYLNVMRQCYRSRSKMSQVNKAKLSRELRLTYKQIRTALDRICRHGLIEMNGSVASVPSLNKAKNTENRGNADEETTCTRSASYNGNQENGGQLGQNKGNAEGSLINNPTQYGYSCKSVNYTEAARDNGQPQGQPQGQPSIYINTRGLLDSSSSSIIDAEKYLKRDREWLEKMAMHASKECPGIQVMDIQALVSQWAEELMLKGIDTKAASDIKPHAFNFIQKSIRTRINSKTRNYARIINQRTQRYGSTRAEREADLIAKIARDTGICL